MNQIIVNLKEQSYPIYISKKLSEIGNLAQNHNLHKAIAVISDDHVRDLYGDTVIKALTDTDFNVRLYTIKPGESSKYLSVVETIIGNMLKDGLTRQLTVLALGGGVVGDLAGFIAAIYLRGVDFVQIPTTLLAQVDSSVGGKVGVNHSLGKNLIGAYLQPKFVLIDPDVLMTLEKRELLAGLAEVIKYGLIRDASFFEMLEKNLDQIINLENRKFIISCILKCCQIKADVVEQDEKEKNLRRILNFGHTIGHALEASTGYQHFRHGEAVAWGMKAAGYISYLEGYIPKDDSERINHIISYLNLPSIPVNVNIHALLDAMLHDKKQTITGLKWILLHKIGYCFVADKLEQKKVENAVRWLLNQSSRP